MTGCCYKLEVILSKIVPVMTTFDSWGLFHADEKRLDQRLAMPNLMVSGPSRKAQEYVSMLSINLDKIEVQLVLASGLQPTTWHPWVSRVTKRTITSVVSAVSSYFE
jgi:hypothetical protein